MKRNKKECKIIKRKVTVSFPPKRTRLLLWGTNTAGIRQFRRLRWNNRRWCVPVQERYHC